MKNHTNTSAIKPSCRSASRTLTLVGSIDLTALDRLGPGCLLFPWDSSVHLKLLLNIGLVG